MMIVMMSSRSDDDGLLVFLGLSNQAAHGVTHVRANPSLGMELDFTYHVLSVQTEHDNISRGAKEAAARHCFRSLGDYVAAQSLLDHLVLGGPSLLQQPDLLMLCTD